MTKRDEVGDYLSGRAFGHGGDTVGGAMGEAEYWAEREKAAGIGAGRRTDPDRVYAAVALAIGVVGGLWVHPMAVAALGVDTGGYASIGFGILVACLACWRPVRFVLSRVLLLALLPCLALLVCNMLGLEGPFVSLLEGVVGAILGPVFDFLGAL